MHTILFFYKLMLSECSCVNIASQEKWHKQKWQQLWGYIKLFMPTTPHSAKFSKTLESLLEMVYMFSKFCLLADGSRDLFQAEEELFTKLNKFSKLQKRSLQNVPRLSFWLKIVAILWIFSALQGVISSSAWDRSRDLTGPSAKS